MLRQIRKRTDVHADLRHTVIHLPVWLSMLSPRPRPLVLRRSPGKAGPGCRVIVSVLLVVAIASALPEEEMLLCRSCNNRPARRDDLANASWLPIGSSVSDEAEQRAALSQYPRYDLALRVLKLLLRKTCNVVISNQ